MNRTPTRVLLALIVLATFGCGDGTDTMAPDPTEPAGRAPVHIYGLKPTPPSVLDDLDWEEFSGFVTPGTGSVLMGTLTTWPKNCDVALNIPPNALPAGSPPTEFSLAVPTRDSYDRYRDFNGGRGLPLILRLEPSGIDFQVPVQVFATYMPWAEHNADAPFYVHWTNSPVFEYRGMTEMDRDQNRTTVSFDAPHFSDWEVTGGLPDQ